MSIRFLLFVVCGILATSAYADRRVIGPSNASTETVHTQQISPTRTPVTVLNSAEIGSEPLLATPQQAQASRVEILPESSPKVIDITGEKGPAPSPVKVDKAPVLTEVISATPAAPAMTANNQSATPTVPVNEHPMSPGQTSLDVPAIKDVHSSEEPGTNDAYQEEVHRLSEIGKTAIPFRSTPLYLAIRALATTARMNFIAPSEEEFSDMVTLHYEGTPWQLLSVLKRRYNFESSYEDGLWSFYRPQAGEMIARTYEIAHINLVNVKASSNASALSSSSTSTATSGTSGAPFASGSGSGSQGVSGSASNIFQADSTKLVDEIKTLLGIPITNTEANVVAGGAAEDMKSLPMRSKDAGKSISSAKAEVLYLDDTNQLFVVATRQQHEYVTAYLRAADKPQPLIRIDAQLVETARDPRSFLGIDPTGFGRPSISIRNAQANSDANNGTGTGTTGGQRSNLTTAPFDLGNLRSLKWPDHVILSASDLSMQLNLLNQDSTSRVVSKPRLVTVNNKEVAIESVIEEPYASSQTNNAFSGTSGTNGQTTTQLERIKIGTTINILPRIIRGKKNGERIVNLNLVMTVSGKVADKNIFGQLVPITSSRSYDYVVQVPDGYTLAIGGLDETSITNSVNKIPLAGDVPLVGYLFKNESKENSSRNLIAYITPKIIDVDGYSSELTRADSEPWPAPTAEMDKKSTRRTKVDNARGR